MILSHRAFVKIMIEFTDFIVTINYILLVYLDWINSVGDYCIFGRCASIRLYFVKVVSPVSMQINCTVFIIVLNPRDWLGFLYLFSYSHHIDILIAVTVDTNMAGVVLTIRWRLRTAQPISITTIVGVSITVWWRLVLIIQNRRLQTWGILNCGMGWSTGSLWRKFHIWRVHWLHFWRWYAQRYDCFTLFYRPTIAYFYLSILTAIRYARLGLQSGLLPIVTILWCHEYWWFSQIECLYASKIVFLIVGVHNKFLSHWWIFAF